MFLMENKIPRICIYQSISIIEMGQLYDGVTPMEANIMIVDDNIVNNSIKKDLELMNYNIVAATESGEKAVSLATQLKPNLILLNLSLNISSGSISLAEKLNRFLMIPIIYLINNIKEEPSIPVSKTSPSVYLVKPVNQSELKIAIESVLYTAVLKKELEISKIALKEFWELNRITLENIHDPVFITDDTGDFTYVSANVIRVLGYKVGEILELRNIRKLVKYPAFNVPEFNPRMPVENLESVIIDKEGNEHLFLTNIKKVSIKTGTTLFTFHDITNLKKAEKEASRNELYFCQIFEQAPVGIAIIDSVTRKFIKINREYAEILGYSVDEMLEKTFEEITFPDDLKKSLNNLERLLKGEIQSYEIEKRYINKQQSIVWVNLVAVPLWRKTPINPMHLAIVEDVTEKKSSNEKIKSLNKHLRDMNVTLNVLLKNKNDYFDEFEEKVKLSIKELIMPPLELIKNTDLNSEQKSHLKILDSNFKQLMLSFDHADSSKMTKLSPIENQVAKLIKTGEKTSEIAGYLNLSPQTIETHRKNIRKKLGLTHQKKNLRTVLKEFY